MQIHWSRQTLIPGICLAGLLSFTGTARAQVTVVSPQEMERQEDLDDAHSILQKSTLVSIGVTGVLGALTAINHDTAFWDGQCEKEKDGKPMFGRWSCNGLSILHGVSAVVTAGLFIATEVVASSMPISPYKDPDPTKQDAMEALRVVSIGILAVQPIAGLIASHPQIIGIPKSMRKDFSRVLRTFHMATGVGFAGAYTATAVMQW